MSFGNFDRDFDRAFAKTGKRVKQAGCGFAALIAVEVLFGLVVMAGVVYFIAFAITHWLKW